MGDRVLHLVVPGLLGPMSHLDDMAAGQRFPAIERWLARADRSPVAADADELLFQLFGVDAPAQGDLPTGAVCYLADTGKAPVGVVYHATPVHLRPDQDRLLLFDSPAADLTADEAAAFVSAFNAHFSPDGWRLEAPMPARWYLHVDEGAELRTRPLGDVIGRNVDLFLPQGADAPAWGRHLTELQMLFHALDVNMQREIAGRPAVNSLWLHGGGRLPAGAAHPLRVEPPAPPLVNGLARLAGTAGRDRLHWLGRARRAVWDADPAAWLAALSEVEATLCSLAGEAVLYPGDGFGYRCGPSQRRRLWRRSVPLVHRLRAEPTD